MTETVVLGGGCFWCVEAPLKQLTGVRETTCGYAGGDMENPSYREVCNGTTGHAEVVRVRYNPDELSLDDLLEVFFSLHNPTTRNREGPDIGSQYRSIILYPEDQQKSTIQQVIRDRESAEGITIVTEVEPLETFYRAEEKHQDYFEKNPNQPYCQAHIPPKLDKLETDFTGLMAN